jgi:hypothetical protein
VRKDQGVSYILTDAEHGKIKALIAAVLLDKPAKLIATELAATPLRKARKLKPSQTLKPGESCIYCGSVGDAQARPEPKHPKPKCSVCDQPFSRATPWRLLRGKRLHIACIPSHD